MRAIRLFGVVACLLISGCATGIYAKRGAELEAESTTKVALAFGEARKTYSVNDPEPMRLELARRQAFTIEQWNRIESKSLKVGDSQEMVAAMYGYCQDQSTITNRFGTCSALVYGTPRSGGCRVIYLRGTQVVAIEE